ncbi:MAG TPA: hypothetical protein VFF81_00610 [Noviherbaspirillum sp.]|nr:hypothetical protein [Noviherbaspirillum sp.]
MQRILTFEQTPPLSVPLRFFLTAPLFAFAAALLLLWHGSDAFATRWSPVTLGLTHLLTLGFLAMCMIGALLQMLPVVAGVVIPYSRLTAGATHALLVLGTLALVAGFLTGVPTLFKVAIPMLLVAFGWLVLAGLRGALNVQQGSDMLTAIRLALTALGIAVSLGLTAASGFAWPLSLPLMQITDLHAAWALLGWVGLLVVGVAYQVVPMFQVTPTYPRILTQWFTKAIFVLLALWSAASLLTPSQPGIWQNIFAAMVVCGYVAFCCITFFLLWQRKRATPDATTMFWRTSLGSLLACSAVWLTGVLFPAVAGNAGYPLALGVLFIIGFGYSVINGMLYKIVPFLVWYHLQNQLAGGCAKAPNVKQILPDAMAQKQFRVHLLALALLLASTIHPKWVASLAAVAFAVSSAWLWLNLMKAARVYHRMMASQPAQKDATAT